MSVFKMMLQKDFTPYIGIQFIDKGRTKDGADCWGLVRLVYAELANIELPIYAEISSSDLFAVRDLLKKGSASETWNKLSDGDAICTLDIVAMAPLGHINTDILHVGVMINSFTCLHTEAIVGSHIVKTNDPLIANRILGYYRHKNLGAVQCRT